MDCLAAGRFVSSAWPAEHSPALYITKNVLVMVENTSKEGPGFLTTLASRRLTCTTPEPHLVKTEYFHLAPLRGLMQLRVLQHPVRNDRWDTPGYEAYSLFLPHLSPVIQARTLYNFVSQAFVFPHPTAQREAMRYCEPAHILSQTKSISCD